MVSEKIDRRTVIQTLGVAGVVGLAGCSGNGEDDGSDTTDGGDDSAVEETRISWHAGGQGGTYYPLSNQFKTIIDEQTDYTLQVQSTGASVQNVGSLADGSADFALIQNDIASFARNGTGIDVFEGEPVENLRGVATLYPETIHIVTRTETGIESLADLEGRTINTGDLGSGTQVNALQILETAGITTDDFDERNDGFSTAANQLQNGDIDASFVVGGWPVGAIEELAQTTDISVLNLSDDELDGILNTQDFFAEDTIPAGTYEGVSEETTTVSVQAMIATREEYDADIVETVTETLFNNVDELSIKSEFISQDSAQTGMPIELHPGAARVFEGQ